MHPVNGGEGLGFTAFEFSRCSVQNHQEGLLVVLERTRSIPTSPTLQSLPDALIHGWDLSLSCFVTTVKEYWDKVSTYWKLNHRPKGLVDKSLLLKRETVVESDPLVVHFPKFFLSRSWYGWYIERHIFPIKVVHTCVCVCVRVFVQDI